MPTLTQPAESTQPVQQQVYPPSGTDPTGDPVYMAFVPMPASGSPSMPAPASGMWKAATWETDNGPVYWASCTVGPELGAIALEPGAYAIAVRVVDSSARPGMWGWSLIIT